MLDQEITVAAPASTVFALINDVERVVSCLPGAVLEGRDGDFYLGTVKVKVGPISASYCGRVQFTEVDSDKNRLRLMASGNDSRGSGDAEAEVELTVTDTVAGARLNIRTDLIIRGKIAQFGKGAIPAVSGKILQAFAVNLGAMLEQDEQAGQPAAAPVAVEAAPGYQAAAPAAALDGLGLFITPAVRKWAPIGAAFLAGVLEGWLVNRAFGRDR